MCDKNGMTGKNYYTARIPELIGDFEKDIERWKPLLVNQYAGEITGSILNKSYEVFLALIPRIPYIGGDQSYTASLIRAVRCLALYQSMKELGKTAEETGKILYDAVLAQANEPQPQIPPSQWLTPEQLLERRKQQAKWSQEHRFPEGFVYEFVPGDGIAFDYGYDFFECASQKFYHKHDADEFMPYFCYLDYAYSSLYGPELMRTMTLAEGFPKCNHRFRIGEKGQTSWPPSFRKSE
jgi:L-2-amino-thiazoline-4-carboxylic acid hydrolase